MRSKSVVSLLALLFVTGTSAGTASAQSAPARAPSATLHTAADRPRPRGELVFALASGMEDIQAMNMALRQARAAAETHRLASVTLLVYGRGVQALDGAMPARPVQTAQLAREALAAGVRVVVCANALQQMGVSPERLDPQPTEVAPNAIATLVDFATRGATVIRY